jgi:hypothetical protein
MYVPESTYRIQRSTLGRSLRLVWTPQKHPLHGLPRLDFKKKSQIIRRTEKEALFAAHRRITLSRTHLWKWLKCRGRKSDLNLCLPQVLILTHQPGVLSNTHIDASLYWIVMISNFLLPCCTSHKPFFPEKTRTIGSHTPVLSEVSRYSQASDTRTNQKEGVQLISLRSPTFLSLCLSNITKEITSSHDTCIYSNQPFSCFLCSWVLLHIARVVPRSRDTQSQVWGTEAFWSKNLALSTSTSLTLEKVSATSSPIRQVSTNYHL